VSVKEGATRAKVRAFGRFAQTAMRDAAGLTLPTISHKRTRGTPLSEKTI
jgi:hypothetical protein